MGLSNLSIVDLDNSFFYIFLKIGLTGSYGCGKSTVLKLFADFGWRTIQADRIGHSLLETDPIVRDKVYERWGGAIFNEEGSICRKRIAKIVFSDVKQLNWLEQLLHPKIKRNYEELIELNPSLNYLVEVPLLFEKKLENTFDFSVCVMCTDSIAIQRMNLSSNSSQEFKRRNRLQLPVQSKAVAADFIISNSGNLAFLKKQVTHLLKIVDA